MKVLIVITKSNFGGAQRYVYDLATSLHKRGEHVAVACGGAGRLVDLLTEAGVRIIPVASLQRDISVAKEFAVFKELRHIIHDEAPDVVQLNSSKVGGLGAVAVRSLALFGGFGNDAEGRKRKRPLIAFIAHGWAFNEDRPPLQKRVIKFLHWVTIALSDVTIAVARATMVPYRGWPLAISRMRVVHNSIAPFATKTHDEARALLAKEHSITFKEKSFVVGMLAELHHIKGIDVALRAIAQLPNVELVVCGEGQERAHLEALTSELGITDRVHFPGYVNNARSLLPAFDAFLMASRSEALPYAVLEAGAVGMPSIVTNVGGMPEIVHHEQSGLVIRPNDVDTLVAAITRLAGNHAEALRFGHTLHEHVVSHFGLKRMVEKTLGVFGRKKY